MAHKKKPGSLQTRYKKQHGLHHKHSDRYLKVYWPYLPVLAIVILGVIASITILLYKPVNSVASATISAPTLIDQTNALRKSVGAKPLNETTALSEAAQAKANDMVTKNYWSPISPTGQSPWQVIQSNGYNFDTAGENLAYGFSDSSQLFSAWVSSESHKANMVNKDYDDVGFGIAKSDNYLGKGPETVVVALYAADQKLGPLSLPSHSENQPYTSASVSQPNGQTITRIEAITKTNNKLVVFIGGLAVGILACFLIVRHGLMLKKFAFQSEELIVKHPFLDVGIAFVIVGLASLTQTIGFIR